MAILTNEQRVQFREQGYILVSGLIPREIVDHAVRAISRISDAGPIAHKRVDGPELAACYTQSVMVAAAELLGDNTAKQPPERAYAINVLPQPGPWVPFSPHIDGALEKDAYPIEPPPFRLAAMIYLTAVEHHGGGTLVWPESHRMLEERMAANPGRYKMMTELNKDLSNIDLKPFIETIANAGDVLFYSHLCVHSGSMNTTDKPRIALRESWQ